MPVYKGMEIYVVNSKTKVIEGATDQSKVGNKVKTIRNINILQKTWGLYCSCIDV